MDVISFKILVYLITEFFASKLNQTVLTRVWETGKIPMCNII